MSTGFQKLMTEGKPEKGSLRTFQISFRIGETRQQFEITNEFKVKSIYDDHKEFKALMHDGFEKLLLAYLRSLPV